MSRCNLLIEMMDPDATRGPGDKVQGFVQVDVDRAVTCRGLHIILRCRTHGRGNTWKNQVIDEIAYVGEWEPGDELVYPFEFEVPNGPVTYHGAILNVIWEVYAYVDIPWAFDPETQAEFTVVRGEARPSQGPNSAMMVRDLGAMSPPGTAWVPLVGFSLFFLCSSVVMFTIDSAFLAFCTVSIGAVGMLVLTLVAGALRNAMATRKLGEVSFEAMPVEIEAGESLACVARMHPPAAAKINGASLSLVCQEVVVSGSGTNRTTHTEEVLRERIVLAGARTIEGETTWEAALRIPENAAATFYAPDNKLEWRVEFHIDVPWWPDFMKGLRLSVAPRLG